MFWLYVLAGFVVFCGAIWWRYDRGRSGQQVDNATMRRRVSQGVSEVEYRTKDTGPLGGFGVGSGP
jgi:hypothetical protein